MVATNLLEVPDRLGTDCLRETLPRTLLIDHISHKSANAHLSIPTSHVSTGIHSSFRSLRKPPQSFLAA